MTTIFISYRRKDDPYAARGIADALDKQFGDENVYFDLDALLAGLDWREQIDKMVTQCDVMLVVIGDKWLDADESGRSRLENADDLVRVEVSSALKRNIPVIPVLVGNADIPDEAVLPADIRPLYYRQYVQVRATSNFNAQIENLIRNITSVTPETAHSLDGGLKPSKSLPPIISKKWFTIFAVFVGAIFVGLLLKSLLIQPGEEDEFWLYVDRVAPWDTWRFQDSPPPPLFLKVFISVNGEEFRYPSKGEVEWLETGPNMAGQYFRLPETSDYYVIRFTVHALKFQVNKEVTRFTSVEEDIIDPSKDLPFRGEYDLYEIDPVIMSRANNPKLTIHYQVIDRPIRRE